MDEKKKKTILIIFFSLSIGIGQFSFFIATNSHTVWERTAPTSTGNTSLVLTTYPFVPDRYDLYAFLGPDAIDSILGTLRLTYASTGEMIYIDYEIFPGEYGYFVKFDLILKPGRYDVRWTNSDPNAAYIITTHGLWNHIPNGKSPSDLEILIYVISGILMGISFVGVFLQIREYKQNKEKQKSLTNYMTQTPESRNENQAISSTTMSHANSYMDQLSIPNVDSSLLKKENAGKGEAEISPYEQASKEELEKIESEMGIEEPKYTCVVHKGPIIGPNYLCPYCKTFYCLNCANTLKEKGETCWSCHNQFE